MTPAYRFAMGYASAEQLLIEGRPTDIAESVWVYHHGDDSPEVTGFRQALEEWNHGNRSSPQPE